MVKSKERQMLVSDDSGHYYIIPVNKEQAFDAWGAWFTNNENDADGYEEYDGEEFDSYRINGGPSSITFLDPQDKR